MDPFTHTLVGLTAAKAGLDRLSPLATTVCVLAASSPDADVVVGFVTDRWTYLHHHRGITHSIVGVLALAVIVPGIVWALRARHCSVAWKARADEVPRITHRFTAGDGDAPFDGLDEQLRRAAVSAIQRPLVLRRSGFHRRSIPPACCGRAAFLATRRGWPKMVVWGLFATAFVVLSFHFGRAARSGFSGVTVARIVLLVGVLSVIVVRLSGIIRGRERVVAGAALALIVLYWSALALVHRAAYNKASDVAEVAAAGINERRYARRQPCLRSLIRCFGRAWLKPTAPSIGIFVSLGEPNSAPAIGPSSTSYRIRFVRLTQSNGYAKTNGPRRRTFRKQRHKIGGRKFCLTLRDSRWRVPRTRTVLARPSFNSPTCATLNLAVDVARFL